MPAAAGLTDLSLQQVLFAGGCRRVTLLSFYQVLAGGRVFYVTALVHAETTTFCAIVIGLRYKYAEL